MATAFNFIGAFAGTAVAKTIGAGLVDERTTSQVVVVAALLGAIAWNLVTWLAGIPSSSSHALIGGLMGATLLAAGSSAVKWDGIVGKVLLPLVSSPVIGFFGALLLMVALSWIFRNARRRPLAARFRRAAGALRGVHGLQPRQQRRAEDDGGHHPGALLGRRAPDRRRPVVGHRPGRRRPSRPGTAVGGWRIMRTMGHRVVELEPIHGFAAETTAATVLLGTAHLGMPVSTTHVISAAIMGVGTSKGTRGVRWGVARSIIVAWVLTIPATAIVGGAAWLLLTALHVG